MRKTKIAGGLVVAGLLVAGGSAFTASNVMPSGTTAGYGSTSVTGATVQSIHYTLDADGSGITAEDLIILGDQSGNEVKAAFGADPLSTCTTPVYNGTSASTTTCAAGATTATAGTFHVNIVNAPTP